MCTSFSLFADDRLTVAVDQDASTTCIKLLGEADISNHAQLLAALEEVDLTTQRETHVHLAELTFCDLWALRALKLYGMDARPRCQSLISLGASPTMRKLVAFQRAEEALNIRDDVGAVACASSDL